MIRHRILQTKTAKPTIGQVQMHLFTESALRADAEAVADDQHADHQFRVDQGPTVWVILGKMLAQLAQIKKSIDTRSR